MRRPRPTSAAPAGGVRRTGFPTREAARRAIFEYVECFYNRRRRHSGVGFLTPAQAYEQMARAA